MIKKILFTIWFCLITSLSFSAIAFDTAGSTTQTGSDNTVTLSFTVAGNDNRMLIVGVGSEKISADTSVTGIDYNSIAMTAIANFRYFNGGGAGDDYISMWYLLAPSTGTNNIDVTFTNSVNGATVGAISIYNAAQEAPEASNTNSGTGTTATVNVTTQTDGAWLIDTVANVSSAASNTPASGQNERWASSDLQTTDGGNELISTAGTETHAWTVQSSQPWGIISASFAPFEEAERRIMVITMR